MTTRKLGVNRKRSAAFTLVEMVVVVTLVGVLLMIAVPSFRTLILNQGIKTASYDLFSALQYARSEAIKRNGNTILKAGASADGAWIAGWRVVDSSNNVLRSWGAASNLTIAETANGGATSITFARDGHISAPAQPPRLQVDPSASVSGVSTRCVGVDLIGRPTTKMGTCS
jgi:type IV fimbrial biogenesis protein FimT